MHQLHGIRFSCRISFRQKLGKVFLFCIQYLQLRFQLYLLLLLFAMCLFDLFQLLAQLNIMAF